MSINGTGFIPVHRLQHFDEHQCSMELSSSTSTTASLTSTATVVFAAECVGLALLNAVTVAGNALVVLAVALNKRLRSTTHLFVASLAVADLAVGFFVLPLSTANELAGGRWPFGRRLCRLWLTVDVWLCTASIYNLLAVTVDRYVAVTKPLAYRFVVTRRRALAVVAAVWAVSLLICLPFVAVVRGRPDGDANHGQSMDDGFSSTAHRRMNTKNQSTLAQYANYYANHVTDTDRPMDNGGFSTIHTENRTAGGSEYANHHAVPDACACTQMDNSPGYIVYSALGSFYAPMTAICYFYFRIYLTVRRVANAGQSGLVVAAAASLLASSGPATVALLAQQRRRIVVRKQGSSALRVHRGGYKPAGAKNAGANKKDGAKNTGVENSSAKNSSPAALLATRQIGAAERKISDGVSTTTAAAGGGGDNEPDKENDDEEKAVVIGKSIVAVDSGGAWIKPIKGGAESGAAAGNYGKRYQRKLTIELKALKIVGIVTGCFVASWLGFCIVYSMQVLPWCRRNACVAPSVVSLVVWLGYANSALNPFIYAACNQHYRATFRRIARCSCVRFAHWDRQRRQRQAVATLCRQAAAGTACMLVVGGGAAGATDRS